MSNCTVKRKNSVITVLIQKNVNNSYDTTKFAIDAPTPFPGVMLTFPLFHWIQSSVASLRGLVCGGMLGDITGIWNPFPGGI